MEAANVGPDEVDFICVGTTTPDLVFPNVGTLLQQRLGIHGCPAFSIEAACTGFIYALSVAEKFVRLGESRCALVVGAETLSRIVDWTDRSTCVLFGDGAGAVVLKPSAEPGIIATHLHADGQYKDLLYYPDGVSKGFDAVRRNAAFLTMKGNEVYKLAVNTLGRIVGETLAANHVDKSQIDWLIPHQANIRIIEATAKRLGLPMERVIVTVPMHGNTSAGVGSPRFGHGYPGRPDPARAAAIIGGLRRWIYLGIGVDPLLMTSSVHGKTPPMITKTRLPACIAGVALLSMFAPVRAEVFPLQPGQDIIGEPGMIEARHEDTLPDIARLHHLGFDEIVAANPGVDAWLPGEGTHISLPTQRIIPDVPHSGLVVNLAEGRLYYFREVRNGASLVRRIP